MMKKEGQEADARRLFSSPSLLLLVVRHLLQSFINSLNLSLQVFLLGFEHRQILFTLANQTPKIVLDARQRTGDEPAGERIEGRGERGMEERAQRGGAAREQGAPSAVPMQLLPARRCGRPAGPRMHAARCALSPDILPTAL